jgi:phage major head subunit gpT-like protein
MALITAGDALLKATAKAAFWQSYEAYPSIMNGLVYPVTSDADQETYPWLAYAPGIREMTGGRVKRGVPELSFTIKNKKWENTVSVSYETRKFAKLNQVQAMLGNLGAKARAYPDKLTSVLIQNGATAGYTCYDGQVFWYASHADTGAAYTTAQSNVLTYAAATGTTWTDVEMANAILYGISSLMGYKDGDGDPVFMDQSKKVLIQCAPDIYARLASLTVMPTLTGGASNPALGRFEVVANPWLTAVSTTDVFFMFNVSGAHKPFILQTAEAVSLEDDMGGDNDFNTKDVSFGSFAYYNVGYGDWRYGLRMTAT